MTAHTGRARHKDGAAAAKRWWAVAPAEARIKLAACEMTYGETLNNLAKAGFHGLPASVDADFSWGFFKQVKGKIHHALWKQSGSAGDRGRP